LDRCQVWFYVLRQVVDKLLIDDVIFERQPSLKWLGYLLATDSVAITVETVGIIGTNVDGAQS
jgi:hypothetical protein